MLRDLPKRSWSFEIFAAVFLVAVSLWTWSAGEKRSHPKIPAPIMDLRMAIDKKITAVFPPTSSQWVSGLLLGDDSGFSKEVREAFRRTGTSHLTAVSGYNVSLVLVVVASLFRLVPLRRKFRVALGLMSVTIFILLTGAPASVLRAGLMAAIIILATELGRQVKPLRALLLATVVLVAFSPPLLLYDLGFQLSLLATFGLVTMSEPLSKTIFLFLPATLSDWASQTVAATVLVAPLIAYYFGQFSAVSVPANIAVMFMIPLLMAIGSVLLLLGFIYLPLAQLLADASVIIFEIPLLVISSFAKISFASSYGMRSMLMTAITTIIILSALYYWSKKEGEKRLL